MFRMGLVAVAMAVVVGIPFALRPEQDFLAQTDDSVVVISPHAESIRYEFTRAFCAWYQAKTGRTISIDWRLVGGTSEIARYLQSSYFTAFKAFWMRSGRPWTSEVAGAFDNGSITLPAPALDDTQETSARRAFLESDVGVGIDVFFGGGVYDFSQQAAAGRLVDCGIVQAKPEWFTDTSIPRVVSGEIFYDEGGRWIGTCLSSFGICYNSDSLERLGIEEIPAAWSDLADSRLFGQVALADPTKSGSAAKAFEMVLQQQMQAEVAMADQSTGTRLELDAALARGWESGFQLIQKAAANARYFTDSAGAVPSDVANGNAAVGMCIDFYGRYESERIQVASGRERMHYFTPRGGSSIGVDPIGLLRGAPNREAAIAFIEFVLSLEGQKLWNFKVGTPGGPVKYALRRLPIRKELYMPSFAIFRSDPGTQPYEEAESFSYHESWTSPLFRVMSFIIRVMCLDTHAEQAAAWKAIIENRFPPKASAKFSDVSTVSYVISKTRIRPVLRSADRIEEVKLANELGQHFRRQYREAQQLAKDGQ